MYSRSIDMDRGVGQQLWAWLLISTWPTKFVQQKVEPESTTSSKRTESSEGECLQLLNLRSMLRRPHNKDSPPFFSHEFVIQNHADIISCVCMVIFMGLIPQFSNSLASSIIFVQYNKTIAPKEVKQDSRSLRIDTKPLPETVYEHGVLDVLNVVFYALVWIIIHALLQEYIWERTAKRVRLSKVKVAKYYDSGSLVVFYLVSLVWGINYIINERYLFNWQLLWDGYPHESMRLSLKFYMLNQMAFWLHCYPELYFMKVKKEKMYDKIVLYTSSLLMIAGAYMMKLQRLAVILLVLHYSVEFLFHASRLLHYHGKDEIAIPGFKLWRVLFVLVRVGTVFISVLTLWFGLGKVHEQLQMEPPPQREPRVDEGEGEGEGATTSPDVGDITGFNKLDFIEWPYRLFGLSFILSLQLWVGWTFLHYQMERSDKQKQGTSSATADSAAPGKRTKGKADSKKNDKSPKATKPKTS